MLSRIRGISRGYNAYSKRLVHSALSSNHIEALTGLIGSKNILTPADERFSSFTSDWTHSFTGGGLICIPDSVEQVSSIMKYCNQHNIAIVPQGGNTGLVGGAVGRNSNEIIISMKKLNEIIEINEDAMSITLQSGCTLQSINGELEKHGLMIPLDLGSKGSCMIGGNISTNAGGLRVLKYGSIGKNVLGLEVVGADGTIRNMLTNLLKDNNGYNLNSLFIGSEGTLGIITSASLRIVSKPLTTKVMLIKVPSFSQVSKLLRLARKNLEDILSAFEFMDYNCINTIKGNSSHLLSKLPDSLYLNPISQEGSSDDGRDGISGEILVLMEISSSDSNTEYINQRLEKFLTLAVENEIILDAIMSKDTSEEQKLWSIRENIPISLMTESRTTHGKLFKYDISLNLKDMNQFIATVQAQLYQIPIYRTLSPQYDLFICNFGHVGDQNLHLNVLLAGKPEYLQQLQPLSKEIIRQFYVEMDAIVIAEVVKRKGSISAEHGIGQLKRDAMMSTKPTEMLELMESLKSTLDPKGILNPNKVLTEKTTAV